MLLLSKSNAPEPVAPDLYLVNRGALAETEALALTRRLRLAGLAVELDASGSAFGKQFKRADRSGAAWAGILGDDEARRGVVRLKSLRSELPDLEFPLEAGQAVIAHLRA